jgi:hypothetical protein
VRSGTPSRAPTLVCVAALAVGVASLALAAASGPPYLSTSGINGWIVVLAAALLTALLALPFVIEAQLREAHPESDSRWDRAVPIWGGVALIVTALGALIGTAGGFAGDSLAGSAGVVATGAGGLVLIAVLSVLLSG